MKGSKLVPLTSATCTRMSSPVLAEKVQLSTSPTGEIVPIGDAPFVKLAAKTGTLKKYKNRTGYSLKN